MALQEQIRKIIRGFGYDVVAYSHRKHPLARRKKLLDTYGISLVLDVGANVGQYAQELRDIGYPGRMVSFEPLKSAYARLLAASGKDRSWDCLNIALGDRDELSWINVSANTQSSSLLEMLPEHERVSPKSRYVGKEEIEVKALDSIFDDIRQGEEGIWLKIDAQGFEKNVLEGAETSLQFISTIQLEMSLRPLYAGELLLCDMQGYLNDKGYGLVAVEPGYSDKATGEVLQVDGIFHRVD